jgi:hypothetical protein
MDKSLPSDPRCLAGGPTVLASCITKNAFQDFSGMFQGLESRRGSRFLEPLQSGKEPSSFDRSHDHVQRSVAKDQSDWNAPSAVEIDVMSHQQIEGKQFDASHGPTSGPHCLVYRTTSSHFVTASSVVQKYGRHSRPGNANGVDACLIGWKPLIQVSSWI